MNLSSLVPDAWRKGIVNALGGNFDSSSDNPQRSSTVYFPLDSTKEIQPRERRELIKKHRMLRNNLGFVRGIINTTVRLSIGWGMMPIPKSGDKDFDRRALAYYKRQTAKQSYDVSGQDHGRSMQRLVLREVITDGEIFGIKVIDGYGRPQRQLIKTEQIGNPDRQSGTDNWKDGVLLNSLGRPLIYNVRQNSMPGSITPRSRPIEARNMLHIFDRERAGQEHGLPWGYTGQNHGLDAIDLAAFEKIAHKFNTAVIGSMTTKDGAAPASMEAMLAAAARAASEAGATAEGGEIKGKEGMRSIKLHGSTIPIFKTGESMNFFQGRNSATAIEMAGWLCAQYAQGFGIPVEMVVGLATGSAAVRGNTDIAGRFFEENQMLMIDDWCQPDYENIVGTGILAATYPRDFPLVEPLEPPRGWTGWDVCEWRGPKNVTVDRGRDGKLYLDLKRAGWMTDEEYWTLNGEDPEEMSLSIDDELVARRERWLARGLPEDMFWRREFGQNVPAGAGVEEKTPPPVTE